ncbi:MAG: AAA family ATPase [bacterium]
MLSETRIIIRKIGILLIYKKKSWKKILNIQNPHWANVSYKQISDRSVLDRLIKKLSLKEIQVLLGVRRSGKSTLFKLLINHILKQVDGKEIFYINLDDPFFSEVWDDAKKLYSVVETAEKITGTNNQEEKISEKIAVIPFWKWWFLIDTM